MTTDIDRAEVFSRPAARFDEDGQLEIRASSALGCRRALWYAATGYEPANPPSEDSLTAMEAGNALEPVVLRAMERAGWQVSPADPRNPESVSMRLRPNLLVTGHPDATGRLPLPRGGTAASEPTAETFLFGDEPAAPAYGDEMVVEVKTRGPEAFKRWRTLGAERSHPASVAQAAFYTYGKFGGWPRDAVIATMDTGNRTWDYEIIPADRLERALDDACKWLGELAAHHVQSGPDPDALPDDSLLGQLPQAQRAARPGGPGRRGDRERVRVRAGDLDAPTTSAGRGRFPLKGTAPPNPIQPHRKGETHA